MLLAHYAFAPMGMAPLCCSPGTVKLDVLSKWHIDLRERSPWKGRMKIKMEFQVDIPGIEMARLFSQQPSFNQIEETHELQYTLWKGDEQHVLEGLGTCWGDTAYYRLTNPSDECPSVIQFWNEGDAGFHQHSSHILYVQRKELPTTGLHPSVVEDLGWLYNLEYFSPPKNGRVLQLDGASEGDLALLVHHDPVVLYYACSALSSTPCELRSSIADALRLAEASILSRKRKGIKV